MTWRGYKRATRELVLTWWLPTAAALPATLFGADERLVLLWFAVTFAVSLRHRDSVIVLDVAVVRAAITALLGIALFWIGTSANARRVEAGERVPTRSSGCRSSRSEHFR